MGHFLLYPPVPHFRRARSPFIQTNVTEAHELCVMMHSTTALPLFRKYLSSTFRFYRFLDFGQAVSPTFWITAKVTKLSNELAAK